MRERERGRWTSQRGSSSGNNKVRVGRSERARKDGRKDPVSLISREELRGRGCVVASQSDDVQTEGEGSCDV